MKTGYRRDMYGNYLILSEGESLPCEAYQIRMLVINEIPGFLPCHVHEMDGCRLFYYNVTSRQSLQTIQDHKQMQSGLLELLFQAVSDALEQCAEYLLDADGLMLRPEYIFVNPEKTDVRFCYWPENDESFREQLRALAEYLLTLLDHEDRRAVFLGYEFYRLSMGDEFTADALHALLRECRQPVEQKESTAVAVEKNLDEELVQQADYENEFFDCEEDNREKKKPGRRNGEKTGERTDRRFAGILFARWKKIKKAKKKEKKREEQSLEELLGEEWEKQTILEEMEQQEAESREGMAAENEETLYGGRGTSEWERRSVAEGGGHVPHTEPEDDEGAFETVFLGEARVMQKQTIREKAILIPQPEYGKSVIALENDSILIGKSRRAADLVLPSPAVSRIHVRMLWDGETYRMEDQNSRNGTRVNGELLQSDELYALRDGDVVEIADLKYIYRLVCEEK